MGKFVNYVSVVMYVNWFIELFFGLFYKLIVCHWSFAANFRVDLYFLYLYHLITTITKLHFILCNVTKNITKIR